MRIRPRRQGLFVKEKRCHASIPSRPSRRASAPRCRRLARSAGTRSIPRSSHGPTSSALLSPSLAPRPAPHARATRVPRNTASSATATTPTATNASPRCAYAAAGRNNWASPSAANSTSACATASWSSPWRMMTRRRQTRQPTIDGRHRLDEHHADTGRAPARVALCLRWCLNYPGT